MKCPQCSEANDVPIGVFGRLRHYRCRACGWVYNNLATRNRAKPAPRREAAK
jgi:transposase-like protein